MVPFRIQKDCEEAKCYLMFPKSTLHDDATRPPDFDPAFHRLENEQAPSRVESESASNDPAYHFVTVRATVVLL